MRYRHQFILDGYDIEHYSLEKVMQRAQPKAAHDLGAAIIENVGLKRTIQPRPSMFRADDSRSSNEHYDIEIDAFPHDYWSIFCDKILNIAGERNHIEMVRCIAELESRTIKKPVNNDRQDA